MTITSTHATGRGGGFVNKNCSFIGSSIICLEIKMPHPQIPNISATNGVRTQTGPNGVLITLLKVISLPTLVMYDAVGNAVKDSAGNPTYTVWNIWIKSDIPSNDTIGASAFAQQIEQSIRQIPSDKFPGYTFNTVTVAIGKHYDP